jgi:hypothetical protein
MDRRLLILALGMFAMGIDNFVVAGILPKRGGIIEHVREPRRPKGSMRLCGADGGDLVRVTAMTPDRSNVKGRATGSDGDAPQILMLSTKAPVAP